MSSAGKVIATASAHLGEVAYKVALQSGPHQLTGDEPRALGGGDAGPSPFGLVLSGLGSCTAITLRMYCEHKGWPTVGVHVSLSYGVVDGAARIERVIRLDPGLDDAQRARLAEIAEKTPVTLALKTGTPIETLIA